MEMALEYIHGLQGPANNITTSIDDRYHVSDGFETHHPEPYQTTRGGTRAVSAGHHNATKSYAQTRLTLRKLQGRSWGFA